MSEKATAPARIMELMELLNWLELNWDGYFRSDDVLRADDVLKMWEGHPTNEDAEKTRKDDNYFDKELKDSLETLKRIKKEVDNTSDV